MKKLKKTPKQLREERERKRKLKKKEFGKEYHQYKIERLEVKELLKEFGSRTVLIKSKKNFVEEKLQEWENQQPLIITGKYKDDEGTEAIFQQKFVEYFVKLYPKTIEDLRELAPHFDKLFKENKDSYNVIFNWHKNELFNLNQSLDGEILSSIIECRFLGYDSLSYKNFRYDYKFGQFRLLFQVLYLLIIPENEEKKEKTLQNIKTALLYSITPFYTSPLFPNDIDKFSLFNLILNQIEKIISDLFQNNYFIEKIESTLSKFLKDVSPNEKPDVESFIILQYELMTWAEKYYLEKDWLLRYGYLFVSQFSENSKIEISEIQVRQLKLRSLAATPFNFSFNGWLAGDETKENYEKRVEEMFEIELENYFQRVGFDLELNKKTRITKPNDPDYDSIKWLLAWNEGASMQEIANCFYKHPYTIKDGLKKLTDYDLPKRIGSPGKKKHSLISESRLLEIKEIKLGENLP